MSKRISQLTQLTAAQLAQDDKIPIVDTSAGQTKYITTKDLTGLPDTGWIATGETWAYSSWDSATRIGVITVPSDATTKYTLGMRIRISQTTGGTKYGIIHAITSTTLTVFFMSGQTFTNETVTSPVYSPLYAPYGFDADPANWQLEVIDTTLRQGNTPTKSVWYLPSGSLCTLAIGIGKWWVEYYAANRVHSTASSSWASAVVTLSTTTNSETDTNFTSTSGIDQASAGVLTLTCPHWRRRKLTLAAKTTYNLLAMSDCQGTMGGTNGFNSGARITATSAYIS